MTIWETLGVDPAVAVADLRRRYAALIKEFRPETHPQDFARIRAAYEVALPWARRREAEIAEQGDGADSSDEAVQEAPADPGAAAPEDELLSIEDEPAITKTAIAAVLGDEHAAAPDAEPCLATQFRRFQSLAEAAVGTRDEGLLPELRALLLARAGASLDDSQTLEFALMRWFIEAEDPPLTLLFETGRAFDWHAHAERLCDWLSPWALRQLEARLSLSRDLAWARHFSGNRWLRRLHAPASTMSFIGRWPQMQDALLWAERWRLASSAADAQVLASHLDAQTLRRLRGRELLSTDVIAGLAIGCTAPSLPDAPIYIVIGIALTFALRLGALWLRLAPGRYRLPAALNEQLLKHPGIVFLLVIGLGGMGLGVFAADDASGIATGIAMLLIVPALLTGLVVAWRGLAWAERCVDDLFAWRDAVDRLEFDRYLRSRWPAEPPSPRLTLLERLKSIPAAMRLRRVEIALRARPARTLWFQRLTEIRRLTGLPRILWVGAWILFAILHYTHMFGATR
jgi:hypothetical protein